MRKGEIMQKLRYKLDPIVLTLLRISTGVIMTAHGWGKLTNIQPTIDAFTGMGIPSPTISVYLAIAGEFLGGLGLLIGFLTPLAAFGIFCTMAVAIFKVHWPNGLMAQNQGFEYPMTLFFVSLYFIIRGAGPISIDRLVCRDKCKAPESSEI